MRARAVSTYDGLKIHTHRAARACLTQNARPASLCRVPLCRASSEGCSKDEIGKRAVKMRESQRVTLHTGSRIGVESAPGEPTEFTSIVSAQSLAPRRPHSASPSGCSISFYRPMTFVELYH